MPEMNSHTMQIDQSGDIWTARSPAKLNLFFEVFGKRPDGFHDVASLAMPIELSDTLTMKATSGSDIRLYCEGGGNDLPTDSRNLVVRALELLRQETGHTGGAEVRLTKRIPCQAGLGGGSGNAAAALILARRAWVLDCTDAELSRLSARIGSDGPLFVHPGASLGHGRGEDLVSLKTIRRLHFVLMKPPEGLSTAHVFSRCMETHDGRNRDPRDLVQALKTGSLDGIAKNLFNRLETPARLIWPRFDEIHREMRRLDCLAVRMSGSGTAFYGLCRSARHAGRIATLLRNRLGQGNFVYATAGR